MIVMFLKKNSTILIAEKLWSSQLKKLSIKNEEEKKAFVSYL